MMLWILNTKHIVYIKKDGQQIGLQIILTDL